MESWWDETLRRIHNRAGLVTPDGMPLVWLSRLNGFRHVDRVYGPDLMLALCERSATRGYRHFFYGVFLSTENGTHLIIEMSPSLRWKAVVAGTVGGIQAIPTAAPSTARQSPSSPSPSASPGPTGQPRQVVVLPPVPSLLPM